MMVALLIVFMALTIHLLAVAHDDGTGGAGHTGSDVDVDVMPRSLVLVSTKFLVPAATMLDNTVSHSVRDHSSMMSAH